VALSPKSYLLTYLLVKEPEICWRSYDGNEIGLRFSLVCSDCQAGEKTWHSRQVSAGGP